MAVSCYVGAGDWTQSLCQSSQCSYLLSLSPAPARTFCTAHKCNFFKRLSPHLTKRCSQFSCGSINFYFCCYLFLFKRICFPITKIRSHTANSKVHSYTDGGEFSGYSQCPKGIKEGKSTQNKSKWCWERSHMPFLLLIASCRRLLGGQTQSDFRKRLIPILAPNGETKGTE